jgi:large subunit ribosomal protein L35
MPKLKTRKGHADRFRVTKNGKVIRRRTRESHIRNWKSATRRRRHERPELVDPADLAQVRRALGV